MAFVNKIERTQGDTGDLRVQIMLRKNEPYNLTTVTKIQIGFGIDLDPDSPSPAAIMDGTVDDPENGWVIFVDNGTDDLGSLTAGDYYGQIRFVDAGKIWSTNKFKTELDQPLFDITP